MKIHKLLYHSSDCKKEGYSWNKQHGRAGQKEQWGHGWDMRPGLGCGPLEHMVHHHGWVDTDNDRYFGDY